MKILIDSSKELTEEELKAIIILLKTSIRNTLTRVPFMPEKTFDERHDQAWKNYAQFCEWFGVQP